ncbi:MAG: tRNA pseudouridine(13) synthase TruD, partial [archaeon]
LDFGHHASSFPASFGYESAMLNHLAANPEDFLGAIQVLPKAVQYLFIHAYQSYLFNELINMRIDRGHGLNRIDGDRVVNGTVQLQLFGFQSTFSEGLAGELEKELLAKEGIRFDDFYNRDYSVLSSKGEYRDLKTEAHDLKLLEIGDDERHTEEKYKKLILSFTLTKGNYATVLLRELIKQENIG